MKRLLLSFFMFSSINPDLNISVDNDNFIVVYDHDICDACSRCGFKATSCVSSGKDEAYFCDECLWQWMQEIGIR